MCKACDTCDGCLITKLRERAERAEHRCAELNGALSRTDAALLGKVAELTDAYSAVVALRINLANANAREGNLEGEIERLKGLLGGHTCYSPPLGNPTREEAIEDGRTLLSAAVTVLESVGTLRYAVEHSKINRP